MANHTVKSSLTAISVAMAFARAVLANKKLPIDVNEAQLTLHLSNVARQSQHGANKLLAETLCVLPYKWQQAFFSVFIVPSYDHIIFLRKLMIKQKIDQAIAEGVKQIVFLGGGYDIRGLVTALAYPDVSVYEIDRGPTRASKMAGLANVPTGIGFDQIRLENVANHSSLKTINGNLYYIDADLAVEEFAEVLNRYGYQQNAKSLIIAEGLTMYLDEAANRRLLKSVVDLLPSQSELIIGYHNQPRLSRISNLLQRTSNEAYRFFLPLEKVIAFAGEYGFDVTQKFTAAKVLQLVDDRNAEYYHQPGRSYESFFSFRKQAEIPQKNIQEVPLIQLKI